MTNANLVLDERALSAEIGRPVRVVNDLVAAAAGVAVGTSKHTLLREGRCFLGIRRSGRCFLSFGRNRRGPLRPVGSFWVVGLGTGVGASLVVPGNGHMIVLPGEGGHSAVSPSRFAEFGLDELTPVEDLLSANVL